MALNIGNLVATLSLNFTAFAQGLNGALATARNVGSLLQSEFRRIDNAANNASNGTRNLGTSFKDVGRIVSGILISQAFYSGIQAINAATVAVGHFASEMEVAQASFTRMMGSSDRATGFIENMKDFAAVTDFTTEQTLEMSRRLMAMGFEADKVRSTLQVVTDEVSLLGGGYEKMDRIVYALGQIKNSAKLAQPEVRQLTEATVPVAKYLQQAFGLTKDQLQEVGKLGISGADAVAAILQGMERDSKGMTEVLANTTRGMITTIKDDLLLISEKVIAPLFNIFKTYIRALRDGLESLRRVLRERGLGGMLENIFPPSVVTNIRIIVGALKVLGGAFMAIVQAMKPVMAIVGGAFLQALAIVTPIVAQLANVLAQLAYWLVYNVPFVKYLVAALMGLLIANTIARAFMLLFSILRLGAIFGFVAQMVQKLAVAIRVLYIALTSHPIVALITIIVGLLLYAAVASGKLDGMLNKLMNSFSRFAGIDPSKILQPVSNDKIKKDMEGFNKEFDKLKDGTKKVGDEAKKAGKKVKDTFIASFDEVYQIPDQLGKTGDELAGLNDKLDMPNFDDLFKDQQNEGLLIPVDLDFPDFPDLPPLFPGLGGKISAAFETVTDFFKKTFALVEGLLGDVVEGLKEAVKEWQRASNPLEGLLTSLSTAFGRCTSAINDFVKALGPLPTAILAAIPGLGQLVALLKALPVIKQITVSIIIPAFNKLTELVTKFKELPLKVQIPVLLMVPVVGPVLAAIALIPKVKEIFVNVVMPNFAKLAATVGTFFSELWNTVSTSTMSFFTVTLPQIFNDFVNWIGNNWKTVLIGALLAVVAVVAFIFGGEIIAAFAAIGAGIVAAFEAAIAGVAAFFSTGAVAATTGAISTWFATMMGAIAVGLAGMLVVFKKWGADIEKFFTDLWNSITKFFSETWETMSTDAATAWDSMTSYLQTKWTELSKWYDTKWAELKSSFSNLWESFSTTISSYWTPLTTKAQNVANGIHDRFSNMKSKLYTTFSETWSALPPIISSYWTPLTTKTQNIANKLSEIFGGIKEGVKASFSSVWEGIKTVINNIIGSINSMVSKLNTIKISTPSWLGGKEFGFNLKPITPLATGGIVTRETFATLGEQGKKEAVIPLERSGVINEFAKAIASEIKGTQQPVSSQSSGISLSVGILIGDERSYAELERRLYAFRLKELNRKGV